MRTTEFIFSAFAVAVLCLCSFAVIYAGNGAQRRITIESGLQNGVRTASAYIQGRIRQNDRARAVFIGETDVPGKYALVIKTGDTYTWIYQRNGFIMELETEAGDYGRPLFALGDRVMRASDLIISFDPDINLISFSVSYSNNTDTISLSSSVYNKSSVLWFGSGN
jgi:hypothetical protein